MRTTTSLILGEHFEAFIQRKIEGGEYATASEVIREALRDFEREDVKEQALLGEIDAACASRRAKPGVFKRLRKKHARRSGARRGA